MTSLLVKERLTPEQYYFDIFTGKGEVNTGAVLLLASLLVKERLTPEQYYFDIFTGKGEVNTGAVLF